MRCLSADSDETKSQPLSDALSSSPPTNSQSFKPSQNGLKQLEQDLFKPFETISPKGSLDGAFVQPMPPTRAAQPAQQNKRTKDSVDRRRDWVFETPDELLAVPSTDDLVTGRDGQKNTDDKSNLTPLERFYERLYNKEKGKDKKDLTHKADKRDDLYNSHKRNRFADDTDPEDDSDLPLGVRETEREMKRLLAPKERKDDPSEESGRNFFSDVFGLGRTTPSREEIEMQRERTERYKELLGIPIVTGTDNDPLKQFRDILGTSSRNPGFASTMDSSGGLPQQNLFGNRSAAAPLAPNLNLLPEGAQLHVTPSLAPALPKIEAPKSLPPPVNFTVPRRQF